MASLAIEWTSTDAKSKARTIAASYAACARAFSSLVRELGDEKRSEELKTSPSVVSDQYGRLKIWAGNLAAHREGKVSLDHRLREANRMRQNVIDLLESLAATVEEACALANGTWKPYDSDAESITFSDDDDELVVENYSSDETFHMRLADIDQTISYLFKLTSIIRNATPQDRLLKSASINVSHFEPWDIAHVRAKFPLASDVLVKRLGLANCKRRQLLAYMERHHSKLSRHINDVGEASSPTTGVKPTEILPKLKDRIDTQSQAATVPTQPSSTLKTKNTQTTVATFKESHESREYQVSESGSVANASEVSSAVSKTAGDVENLRAPRPPKGAMDGDEFDCPYCHENTRVRNEQQWRGHCFQDIQAYICTIENCRTPFRLFGSRAEWRNHETQVHRKEWECNACNSTYGEKVQFLKHIDSRHPELTSDAARRTLIEMCERPVSKLTLEECPLCLKTGVRLVSHLARHLQSLALFTLPYPNEDADKIIASDKASKGEANESLGLNEKSHASGDSIGVSDPLSEAAIREIPDKEVADEEGVLAEETQVPEKDLISTRFKDDSQNVPKTAGNAENLRANIESLRAYREQLGIWIDELETIIKDTGSESLNALYVSMFNLKIMYQDILQIAKFIENGQILSFQIRAHAILERYLAYLRQRLPKLESRVLRLKKRDLRTRFFGGSNVREVQAMIVDLRARCEATRQLLRIHESSLKMESFTESSTKSHAKLERSTFDNDAEASEAYESNAEPRIRSHRQLSIDVTNVKGFQMKWLCKQRSKVSFMRDPDAATWATTAVDVKILVVEHEEGFANGKSFTRIYMGPLEKRTHRSAGFSRYEICGEALIDDIANDVNGTLWSVKNLGSLDRSLKDPLQYRDVVLLCSPATRPLEDLKTAIFDVQKFCPYTEIFILGIHTEEEHDGQSFYAEEHFALAETLGATAYMECCIEDDRHVDEVMSNVIGYATSLRLEARLARRASDASSISIKSRDRDKRKTSSQIDLTVKRLSLPNIWGPGKKKSMG